MRNFGKKKQQESYMGSDVRVCATWNKILLDALGIDNVMWYPYNVFHNAFMWGQGWILPRYRKVTWPEFWMLHLSLKELIYGIYLLSIVQFFKGIDSIPLKNCSSAPSNINK